MRRAPARRSGSRPRPGRGLCRDTCVHRGGQGKPGQFRDVRACSPPPHSVRRGTVVTGSLLTFPYLRAHRAVEGGCGAARPRWPSLISSSAAKTHRLIAAWTRKQEEGPLRGSGRPARWRGRGWAQRGLRGRCPCGCRGAPGRSSRAEGTHVGPPRADPTALPDRSSNSGPRAAALLARDARTRGAGGDPSSGTPLTGHPGARLTEPLVTPRSLPQGAAPLTPSLCFFAVNEIIRNDLSGTNAHS